MMATKADDAAPPAVLLNAMADVGTVPACRRRTAADQISPVLLG